MPDKSRLAHPSSNPIVTASAPQTKPGVLSAAISRRTRERKHSSRDIADAFHKILARGPFTGHARDERVISIRWPAGPTFVVCVPLRNEERLLPGTLSGLEQALAQAGEIGGVLFLVNDTLDRSSSLIARWARSGGHSVIVAEASFDPDWRSAPVARRLALDLGAELVPDGVLCTTDADTVVAPDWLAGNLRRARAGADLVCGTVVLNERELAALPPQVRACGDLEEAYRRSLAALWREWTGGELADLSVQALGASLVITAACYRAVGGLPMPAAGEDKALARLVRAHGFRIDNASEVRVVTSGRTTGRARGGVSDALRERATSRDPACDEELVPVAVLRRRAKLWRGLADLPDAVAAFGLRCQQEAELQCDRMHYRDVARELEVATRLLEGCEPMVDAA